eukprot:6202805-Pleurochrysis_carterae.AAC.1
MHTKSWQSLPFIASKNIPSHANAMWYSASRSASFSLSCAMTSTVHGLCHMPDKVCFVRLQLEALQMGAQKVLCG